MKTEKIVSLQKEYFNENKTKLLKVRKYKLLMLRNTIKKYEKEITKALYEDLGKSPFESYETDIGLVLSEISYVIKNMEKWAKPENKITPMAHFLSYSKIYKEPYGVVLIMSPWNCPFLLSMSPIIGAVSAGNCFVLKPSAYSPKTSEILKTIIEEVFGIKYGAVILGGRKENKDLLKQNFDYIFFTGSKSVAREVMKEASKNLTPVSLELGGKSPVIVDEKADIQLAAKRIVWGKFINAGQTCVAPDYVFAHKNIYDKLLSEIARYIFDFYGEDPLNNKEYPKIINEKHFLRLTNLLNDGKIFCGGKSDINKLKIEPSVLIDVDFEMQVMKEEIFGPILPVIKYENIKDVVSYIQKNDKPLALYIFTNDNILKKKLINTLSYGGGCINDTIIHIVNHNMPFGGVGASGMGAYHGKYSFDTFSHKKSIVEKTNAFDIEVRYPPFGNKIKIIKKLLK